MRQQRAFLCTFALLAIAYGGWLLSFWPGVMGQDGLAVILQIEGAPWQSHKPLIWYLFAKALYEPFLRVEVITGLHLVLGAIIFSRILAWCWRERLRKSYWFILLFVGLAPPVLFYQGSMYSDGMFCTAVTGLVFESWLICHNRSASRLSLLYLALLLPFALFFRANGIFMLAMCIPLLICLQGRTRMAVGLIFLGWVFASVVAAKQNRQLQGHGALFPLALFETVNFIQPHAMGLNRPDTALTPETIAFLSGKRPIAEIQAYRDADYWDPLVYTPGGPDFLRLTKAEKKWVVREFFCCNLWKNIPAFLSSRVNVFMVSALAQGGFGGLQESGALLARTHSVSQIRPWSMESVAAVLQAAYDWSFANRWLTWTPFGGVALLAALLARSWHRRDRLLFLLMAPLAAQLAGIFMFSIAGEYRYLMLFFTGMAALLPIYVKTRQPQTVRALP